MTSLSTSDRWDFVELQMASALPAGRLVDDVILRLLGEQPVDFEPANALNVVGVPSNLSADGVRSLNLSGRPTRWLAAVLAGLRDPDAVRALAARADRDWLRWVVHLNPVSHSLPAVELPVLPYDIFGGLSRLELEYVRGVLLPSAFPHLSVLSRDPARWEVIRAGLANPGVTGLLASRVWPYGLLDVDESILPPELLESWVDESPDVSLFTDEASRRRTQALYLSGVDPRVGRYRSAMVAESDPRMFKSICKAVDSGDTGVLIPPTLGGHGFENPWLEHVLLNSRKAWRDLLDPYRKAVSGRALGRALVGAVHLDAGAWRVAVDLLREWGDDPLSLWLETAGSLGPSRDRVRLSNTVV